MNKILFFCLIFFLILNCSFNTQSKLWTQKKKIQKEIILKELFPEKKALDKEFNSGLKINFTRKSERSSSFNYSNNNYGRINFQGDLKNISKFKFSKIEKFDEIEPEIVFDNDNLIFFDNKGSILKFDKKSHLVWKKNIYSKKEKKINPILSFANNSKVLIVADDISTYYAINIKNGELLWKKNNPSPFNSQIKIYKDKFFIIDLNSTLRCFSIKNGDEIWNIKTEESFIKSQKKQSIIIINDNIFFSNSVGDITSANIESGELNWQSPTQSSLIIENAFFFKTSDLISNEKSIFVSNNNNSFFSLDSQTGFINWRQEVNSSLRPIIVDKLIFSITMEGFLVIINKENGNIIRITDVFDKFKKKKRNKIKPIGFVIGNTDIYLTTSNGRLMVIDIQTGKTKSIIKIDNKIISSPFILNNNLFIVKENSVVKLN